MTGFSTEADEEDINDIKHCFWLNLFNYKILSKMLEILITKPKVLKSLTNCTMFVVFMVSVKVQINGETLNCYEIFRTMLQNKGVKVLMNDFDEPIRSLEEMPETLKELAVSKACLLSPFGLFMPVRKWANFTVFEKNTFEDQLQSCPEQQRAIPSFTRKLPRAESQVFQTYSGAEAILRR